MRKWRVVVIVAVAAAASVGLSGATAYAPADARCQDSAGKVQLTFDDAAPPAKVNAILDVLAARHVRAGFFILGPWAAANPDVMARIRSEGHWLGNHTASHRALTSLSDDGVRREIAGGVQGELLRPPYGQYDGRVRRAVEAAGYRLCLWSVDTLDWKGRSADAIRETVMRETRPGGVILLHLQAPQTLQALPALIDGLRSRGLELDGDAPYAAASVDPATGGPLLLERNGQVASDPAVGAGGPVVAPAGDAVAISGRAGGGYWVAQAGGGLHALAGAPWFGSEVGDGVVLRRPLVGVAATPSGLGYWTVAADGGVFTHGDARFWGSAADLDLPSPIVALAPTPTGLGYWLLSADGGVFSFGDAPFLGSPVGAGRGGRYVSIAARPAGDGYWVLDSSGGVTGFGAAAGDGAVRSVGADRVALALVAGS